MKLKFHLRKRQDSRTFGALFDHLPLVVKVLVFEKLPLADLRTCRLVCSRWNDVIYGCMRPLRIRLTINFPSEGTPQIWAVKSVTKEDLQQWPRAMSVSSVVCEGFSDSYSAQWSEFICEVLEMPCCCHLDELKTINILHSELSTKKLLRHSALSKITDASFCDQRFTPRMIAEICRFAKDNPLLKSFHVAGFDVDHFDEIFDGILKSSSILECTALAKRGTCTSAQLIAFLQGIVASKRDIHVHGLSIDDLQFNGAMRELRAPHRKGHHLTFFSSDSAFCKPDICAVFDKMSGPAEIVLSRSEDNVPLGTKFLGSLIREELQQQKSYCTATIKVTGVVGFEEKALVVKASISGLDEPLKGSFFDCARIERSLHEWFDRKFDGFTFRFSVHIDSDHHLQKIGRFLPWRRNEPDVDLDDEHSTPFFWGPVNSPKTMDTLTVIRPAYRWTFRSQQNREAGQSRLGHYATRVRIGINT